MLFSNFQDSKCGLHMSNTVLPENDLSFDLFSVFFGSLISTHGMCGCLPGYVTSVKARFR